MTTLATLPSYRSRLQEIAAAEAGDGWPRACAGSGRFLLPSRQFIAALANLLSRLAGMGRTGQVAAGVLPRREPAEHYADGAILEVCAGTGELADMLWAAGVPLVTTDADPPPGSSAARTPAAMALQRYRPTVVLGCFVPVDAGIDELVMACPSVRHYVVLGARLGGCLGSTSLWNNADWTADPLPRIDHWMLTRHDRWLGGGQRRLLRHGEAWHFRRSLKPSRLGGESRGLGTLLWESGRVGAEFLSSQPSPPGKRAAGKFFLTAEPRKTST